MNVKNTNRPFYCFQSSLPFFLFFLSFSFLVKLNLILTLPLQGMEVHGVPEYVIVEGRVCVDECELKAVHGFGKFVETPSHNIDYVYCLIEDREKVRSSSFYRSWLIDVKRCRVDFELPFRDDDTVRAETTRSGANGSRGEETRGGGRCHCESQRGSEGGGGCSRQESPDERHLREPEAEDFDA